MKRNTLKKVVVLGLVALTIAGGRLIARSGSNGIDPPTASTQSITQNC